MKDWRHAWPLIWSQRRDAVAGLALSLLAIAASLLQPWPMQIIVDDILGTKPIPGWLTADKPAALLVVCVGLLAIHFLRGGLSSWSTIYLVRAGLRMTHELRLREFTIVAPTGIHVRAPDESEAGVLAGIARQQGGPAAAGEDVDRAWPRTGP